MSNAPCSLRATLGAVLVLLLFVISATSVRAQQQGGNVHLPDNPISRDPTKPNAYDFENEARHAKIGKEGEIALKEAGAAFSAKPPRYADAEKAYLRAAKLEPKEARAYLGLALVYAAQNEADKTVAALKRAIEVKPKYAEAHFNLGMVLLATGKKNEAIDEYKTLHTLDKELAKKLKEFIDK